MWVGKQSHERYDEHPQPMPPQKCQTHPQTYKLLQTSNVLVLWHSATVIHLLCL